MSTRAHRKEIADDTLARVDSILSSTHPPGSLESTFISAQLPRLKQGKCPQYPSSPISVLNIDSFTAARNVIKQFPDAKGKTTVLNLASDAYRAGGWIHTLSATQEEALCYSSTLFPTLKEEYYPWPNKGRDSVKGIYSPSVVIFKDDLDHDCVDLAPEQRQVVSVITIAAVRSQQLAKDGPYFKDQDELDSMREKIRLVYRIAAHNKQEYLILGAMGCGAYRCPPLHVAEEMRNILLDDEFKGWFREVVFAVYSSPLNPNYDIFSKVFNGIETQSEVPLQTSPTSSLSSFNAVVGLCSGLVLIAAGYYYRVYLLK